ncbi:MAG: hypothetical protein E7100_02885 [Bacteroidaceae bacterium]|nr:hypothetical protein [Bacteroidaceae bacterium]MBQ9674619.1 hypothetical protein [Bacteroidaceae bacterium]
MNPILDLFKYFARFPAREGVLSIFLNGSSSYGQYAELKAYVESIAEPYVPEISSLVFGQDLADVKRRIDSISGNYLFIDFGEFSSTQLHNSFTETQKLAVTVADKVPDSADMVESAIVSDATLQLLVLVRQQLLIDSHSEAYPWLERISGSHDIIPFVAPELKSLGWTLMFESEASDLFNVKPALLSDED